MVAAIVLAALGGLIIGSLLHVVAYPPPPGEALAHPPARPPALGALIIASSLTVVASRLPRGESLAHPPSRCPSCEAPVKPYDNIPVLSWLLLRGRCRSCKAPISPRYPLVEAFTGALWALVTWA